MSGIGHNGGPAFPQMRQYRDSQGIDHEITETGMSLRDWFAGRALQGFLASGDAQPDTEDPLNTLARMSYAVADAMLEARK